MPGRRVERLSEQIREEVSMIIDGELRDPRIGLATVTEAKVTPDLRHARIYVSVTGTDEQVRESIGVLNAAAGFIRHQLGTALRLKYTPEIHFVHDDTVRTAARIEEILKEEGDRMREQEGDQTTPAEEAGPGTDPDS